MNHRVARLIVGALCALVAAGMLAQQAGPRGQGAEITIIKDLQTSMIDCNNSAINITGDDNKITAKGQCGKLTVSGDDNVITVDTVNEVVVSGDDNKISANTVAKISVSGDDNMIKWKIGAGNKPPAISNTGDDNDIRQDK